MKYLLGHIVTKSQFVGAVIMVMILASSQVQWGLGVRETMSVSRKNWPRVVVIGDSITERGSRNGGWGTLLAEALTRKCDVINRGFSGYTTSTTRVCVCSYLIILVCSTFRLLR